MSRSSDKCQPFFQVLKKAFHWDAHCEEAFASLKTYLSSLPILVIPFVVTLEPGPTRLGNLNPNLGEAQLPLNHFIKIIYQKCAEAISIYGKPINIYKFNRPITFYNEGVPCLIKMIYKMDVQSSNCFYKISMFKKRYGVNAYVGTYSAILSL